MQAASASREELLQAARDCLHLPATLDTTARIAAHNLTYGLARIMYALGDLGVEAAVRFFASADFTITRSPVRWGSGQAYGGVLEIVSDDTVVFPELRPNACGCTLGALEQRLEPNEAIARIARVRFTSDRSDWDYGRRNHFVNLYCSRNTGRQIFIVHGCPSALRSDSASGPGLFIDASRYWQAKASTIHTPLGPIRVLLGQDARDFWANYLRCEEATKSHRFTTSQEIFGNFELLGSETHEGMLSITQYLKGCHAATDLDRQYPLLTDIGSPAYLITAPDSRGAESSTPRGIAAVLPHGTGYDLQLADGRLEVLQGSGQRPIFSWQRRGVTSAFADFSHVPYKYRSSRIVRSWAKENIFRICDELLPELFTKF